MNSRRPAGAIAGLLSLSIVFGVLMVYVKGNGAGLRYEVGNTSAPWLVLPLLVGRIGGSRLAATVLGGLSALLSLLAFYGAAFLAYDLFSVATVSNNLFFLVTGTLGGAVFGLAGWLGAGERKYLLTLLLPIAFLAEPAVTFGVNQLNATPLTGSFVAVKTVEALAGALVAGVLLVRLTQRANTRPDSPPRRPTGRKHP